MSQEFLSLFGQYLSEEELNGTFESARLLSLELEKKKREMCCEVIFLSLVPRNELFRCERILTDKLGLSSLKIIPKYTPDLFTPAYFSEIVLLLKRRVSVANGYFNDSTAEFDGNVLKIELRNGGYHLLTEAKTDLEIQKIILEEFSLPVEVQFTGVLTKTMDEHQQMVASVVDELPPLPAEYDAPPASFDVSSVSTETIKSSKKTEHKIVDLKLELKNIPIRTNSAILISGKKFTETPSRIADLSQESGRVTIWGDNM